MSHTPEHAIRECLAIMYGRPARVRPCWRTRPKPVPQVDVPLPFRLMPDTVRFAKKREAPLRQLWYVTFDAHGGWRGNVHWHWTMLVTEEERGRWSAHGVAGGSGDSPMRGYPWANIGGNWGRQGFRAGGTVEDAGKGVARVRLTDVEGRTFEDPVDEGVVLFMSDEPVTMPMRVDLFDADGRLVGSDEWGFRDE